MSIYNVSPALDAAVAEAAKALRSELDARDIPNVRFRVEVSGRVQGDLKIEYVLGELYGESVVGSSATAVLEEFLRRRGWSERNAPLALSYTGDTVAAGD